MTDYNYIIQLATYVCTAEDSIGNSHARMFFTNFNLNIKDPTIHQLLIRIGTILSASFAETNTHRYWFMASELQP